MDILDLAGLASPRWTDKEDFAPKSGAYDDRTCKAELRGLTKTEITRKFDIRGSNRLEATRVTRECTRDT